jgi:class 3 adenylate cyclase
LGDEMAMEFLRVHDRIVRDALAAAKGREVKHTGDGIMASFVSAAAAVRCAVQIQRELARREREDAGSSHQSSHWRRGRGTGRARKTISLERLCNWRRGFVLTPNPTKSWYRPR